MHASIFEQDVQRNICSIVWEDVFVNMEHEHTVWKGQNYHMDHYFREDVGSVEGQYTNIKHGPSIAKFGKNQGKKFVTT